MQNNITKLWDLYVDAANKASDFYSRVGSHILSENNLYVLNVLESKAQAALARFNAYVAEHPTEEYGE